MPPSELVGVGPREVVGEDEGFSRSPRPGNKPPSEELVGVASERVVVDGVEVGPGFSRSPTSANKPPPELVGVEPERVVVDGVEVGPGFSRSPTSANKPPPELVGVEPERVVEEGSGVLEEGPGLSMLPTAGKRPPPEVEVGEAAVSEPEVVGVGSPFPKSRAKRPADELVVEGDGGGSEGTEVGGSALVVPGGSDEEVGVSVAGDGEKEGDTEEEDTEEEEEEGSSPTEGGR
jgi:hypothetical protein